MEGSANSVDRLPQAVRRSSTPRQAAAAQQVALVTGAASGIGREVALQLARRGWRVAAIDQNEAGLRELERALGLESLALAWYAADVTDAVLLEIAVAKLSEQLGSFDLLIAGAGIASSTPAANMQAATIARIININLVGVSNTVAAVIAGMLARRRGHIVAISSLASFRGLPDMMGYSASKAGLNAFMQSLALDVKQHGVLVTTICPGYTRTPQSECMYRPECLMPVERAAAEILWAIARRKRFHAFPRVTAWQLGLLNWLPGWLQDWFLIRNMKNVAKV